jgi:poly(3-hydroxybutyrate) depolymerase
LPNGTMMHRGEKVDLRAIRRVALMTIEGEKDDITGRGQCEAAHDLCANLARTMKRHLLAPKVGHYGIFNGTRYRQEIVPELNNFILTHDVRVGKFRRFVTSLRRKRGIEAAPAPLSQLPQVANGTAHANGSALTGVVAGTVALNHSATGRAAPH